MSDSVTQTTLGVDARLKSLEESVEARIRSAENDSKVRSDRIEADASARLKSLEDAASATKAQLKTLDDFTKKWKYFAAALAALGLGAASIFGYFVKSANDVKDGLDTAIRDAKKQIIGETETQTKAALQREIAGSKIVTRGDLAGWKAASPALGKKTHGNATAKISSKGEIPITCPDGQYVTGITLYDEDDAGSCTECITGALVTCRPLVTAGQ